MFNLTNTNSKSGPIILIEDDEEDRDLFVQAVRELDVHNEILYFDNAPHALDYLLSTTQIVFLIFCDINLPGQNGMELKKQIDQNQELRKKSIPFVFYSTLAKQDDVNEAYMEMVVQGFFKKPDSFPKMKDMLSRIFGYWEICRHPNSDNL